MARWVGRSATEIAAAVQAGQARARDVVAEHLDRIAARGAEVGAFVRVRAAQALSEAEEIDARPDRDRLPLAGVPIAIKDNLPVAGEPMRVGTAAGSAAPQADDHPVVARLRAAGAVVVGLTNLPELGIYPFTDSVFGIARNPWDLSRTAGGTSGGSAVAVAAGLVPVAVGNDGLGSIRIPAAVCGVFGFKPGSGVVPAQVGVDSWQGMSENGPIATSVADAALLLRVMADASFDAGEPRGLRVAVSVKPPGAGVVVHRGYRAAARQCGELLAGLGHVIAADDPPYPLWATPATIGRWLAAPLADAGAGFRHSAFESRTRRHLRAGRLVARVRPPRADDVDRLRAALAPFFERHDVLVMPPLARPCPPALRWGERSWLRNAATSIAFAPMTGIWNVTGFPAAAVPFGTVAGLPGSVQLVAARGGEAALLAIAAQIERARGWPRHAPAYVP